MNHHPQDPDFTAADIVAARRSGRFVKDQGSPWCQCRVESGTTICRWCGRLAGPLDLQPPKISIEQAREEQAERDRERWRKHYEEWRHIYERPEKPFTYERGE